MALFGRSRGGKRRSAHEGKSGLYADIAPTAVFVTRSWAWNLDCALPGCRIICGGRLLDCSGVLR